ncbi:CHAT domain-containing protein [Actinophytocola gossypii]|uniref:CHAT domain-containing protein n=1 Tax=Actinophytocola gossypii TaxID=2812003 RepID=A0ABT2J4F3_9PSEU|nr:CHAT domain-containing protein [Actinophytocola gossypii]MCT2582663.1 CHAT domain-containing protein [Actinophytocola gossypii]
MAVAEAVEQAVELRTRAVAEAQAARPAEAVKLLRKALRALPVTTGNHEVTTIRAKVLATLAFAEAETGSVADGLVHLGTASDLVNGLPEGPLRSAARGLVNHQHGVILIRARRNAEALELFDLAIPALEAAESTPAANPELLATAYMNRGFTYIELGRPGPAEENQRRCLELAVEHDLPQIKGKALGNLGEIAQLVGDVPGALAYHEQAEAAFRDTAPALLARTQIDEARALLSAGVLDDAARHLDEALPVLREHRSTQDLAEAEVARAAVALLQDDRALARHLAGTAHRRFLRRGNEPWAEVAALTRMRAEADPALVSRPAKSSPAKAERLAERLAEVGLPDESAMARMLAVRLALARGDVDTAEDVLERVPSPRKLSPIDHRMLLRLCRAEVALARGQTRRALAQARAGLDELGAARDRMGGLDLVCGTAVHGLELARLALNLVLSDASTDADARRVLAWQEKTRAQVYRYEPQPAIDDPALAEAVTELRGVLRMIQQARLERRPTAPLERRSTALQREVNRLGWHTSHWGKPRPVCSPEEIIEHLGDRAMISFAGPGEDLAAVVVSGGRTRLVRLGRREQALEVARQLHADLDALAPDDLIEPLVSAVSQSALHRIATLNEYLFGDNGIPMELIDGRELVVVPFGGLYSVPWESLPTLRGRAVSVAPSATAWVSAAEAPATDGKVVLVSGPDLPESVSELTHLRTVYPDAVVLDGERATTSAVLAAMDGAKLVHIAAHGTHEPANAMFSRLELVDGGLLAHEVARLHRPPEHIVLAACELALSHIRPGDEPLGFAGAMLASGSRTVVAAVNQVGHRSAALTMTDYHRRLVSPNAQDLAETMTDYHRRLASGTQPARALAEATAADPLRRPFILLGAG